MKAIVLAGGEGTRLRPISAECPKPMVRLIDKPVLEHSIKLLANHGFNDITATLQTLPAKITDYFGDGSLWGVRMSYRIENTPLGTAGGVKACADMIGGGPFVVLSGDAVTDIDLTAALKFHVEKHADVTLILNRQEKLLDYGLVMTGEDRKITQFIEKPSAGQVFTDMVNTGIYVISPHVLELIPEDTFFDFAKDLFPMMLDSGMALYGYVAEGYWSDMGDANAYLSCCCDVLDGKVSTIDVLPLPSHSPDVRIVPPCYIGENVRIGRGSRIGPYCVIGSGSRIGEGASIECSVIDGAELGALVNCFGAYVGVGSVVRDRATLLEGAVVGERVLIGAGARLDGTAKIWPNKEIEADAYVSGSVISGAARRGAAFTGRGILTGQPHVELTPEFFLKLGSAAAGLFHGEISISWQGGDSARVSAMSLETGICAAGGTAVLTDALFGQCVSYGAQLYRFGVSFFLRQKNDSLTVTLYGPDGLPITREDERKLEALTVRGELSLAGASMVGRSRPLGGLASVFVQASSMPPDWFVPRGALNVRVTGGGAAASALRNALELSGCMPRGGVGSPVFSIDEEGTTFSAIDETGRALSHGQMLAMLLWLEQKTSSRNTVALSYEAPAALDEWAEALGIRVLRPGRDGIRAREMHSAQRYMRDAVLGCVLLCYGLRTFETTLSRLAKQVPALYRASADIGLESDQGAVMRALAAEQSQAELVDGLRARVGTGWVHVSPLPGRRALRIVAEGASEEIASEICEMFQESTKNKDRQNQSPVI